MYAESPNRSWEGDARLEGVEGGCVDIAKQFVFNNSNIKVCTRNSSKLETFISLCSTILYLISKYTLGGDDAVYRIYSTVLISKYTLERQQLYNQWLHICVNDISHWQLIFHLICNVDIYVNAKSIY